jgi:hypothetical protein
MANYSQKRVKKLLAASDAAKTADEKGDLFEQLITYLFGKVPGLTHPQRNVIHESESEEIDIAFYNEQHPQGLKSFNEFLLIECKNWSKPVGSAEVEVFIGKVRDRGLDFGILISAQGVTGSGADRKAAHYKISIALSQKIRIIVMTRAEIEALRTTDDLVKLIKVKVCQLVACGTIWP